MPSYYKISRYVGDGGGPDGDGWLPYRPKVRLWTVRRVLRELYSRGYDRGTVLVERHGWLEAFVAEQNRRT